MTPLDAWRTGHLPSALRWPEWMREVGRDMAAVAGAALGTLVCGPPCAAAGGVLAAGLFDVLADAIDPSTATEDDYSRLGEALKPLVEALGGSGGADEALGRPHWRSGPWYGWTIADGVHVIAPGALDWAAPRGRILLSDGGQWTPLSLLVQRIEAQA